MDPRLDRFLGAQPKPFDQCVAEIDALLVRQATERDGLMAQLTQQVRGLDDGEYSSSPLDEPMGLGAEPTGTRLRPPPQPQPEWKPPQRRTHGGNFGPAVLAKLRREALGG